MLHHPLHRSRENAKNKLYRKKNKQSISIAKKARYALNEPKMDAREVYVKNMKKTITSKPTLKRELLRAFRSCCNPLAEKIKPSKLANAVLNISTRKLLNWVLTARKQSVGELLRCIRSVNALQMSCGVDKDGNIVYRKLNKSVLPNHRVYNPNKENEKENYFYSLLLLFVSFRNEEDLIKEGESAKDAFDRHMEQNDALNIHSEKFQRMLKANENVQKINEARQAKQENVTVPEPVEENEGPQGAGEATSAMHDVVDLQQNDESGPSFDDLVSSLNVDQGRLTVIVPHFILRNAARVQNHDK